MRDKALTYLKTALNNPNASFHDGQWESIEHLLNRKRVLVVQRTGWGKSMVYFLATKLLREQGAGPTLLISPLLSLMRNQLEAAQRIRVLDVIPSNIPVLATMATANDRVVNDVESQLGDKIILQRGPLVRKSLKLQNIDMPSPSARLAWLAKTIPFLPGSGIVYTLTQRDAERVTEWLRLNNINAEAYHANIANRENSSLFFLPDKSGIH